MRYLSVCSGIEAATVAWEPLGWKPAAFSEIEPFASAVLTHHYPHVVNLGDMTRHADWPLEKGHVDLLVGGTPCQSFSVAGLRRGLADPRGNLMLVYLGILDRLRPRWCVWENVPGVLSSGRGRDFGAFLGAMGDLGYGWAYRVLDAQWFGVAQRRRRVFVVGCAGDWRGAAAVLFERESLRRHPAPQRAARKGAAADAGAGASRGGGQRQVASPVVSFHPLQDPISNEGITHAIAQGEVSPAVTSKWSKGSGGPSGDEAQNLVLAATVLPFDPKQIGHPANFSSPRPGDPCHPLRSSGNAEPAVVVTTHLSTEGPSGDEAQNLVLAFKPSHFTRGKDGAPSEVAPPLTREADKGDQEAVVLTLEVRGREGGCSLETRQDGTANCLRGPNGGRAGVGIGAVAILPFGPLCSSGDAEPTVPTEGLPLFDEVKITSKTNRSCVRPSDVSPTMAKCHRLTVVGFSSKDHGADAGEVSPTLRSGSHLSSHANGGAPPAVLIGQAQVRRLTPRECERLQGFPDDYTAIVYRNKSAADGPRYKALGNSMAVPVMRWIGHRIASLEALLAERGQR
jgi:DNA (cytosine-5)-methyltransferase 1